MSFDKLAQTINKFIAIADKLDKANLHDDANDIDRIIRLASFKAKTLEEFVIVLKDTFAGAINNTSLPNINEASIPEIFSVIDTVAKAIDFTPTNVSDVNLIKNLEDPVIRTGEGIMALTDDIKKLEQAIVTTEESEKQQVEFDLRNDKKKLENLWNIANQWRDGKRAEDKENWQKLQELFKQRGR